MLKILEMAISTKKGEIQKLRWGIEQEIPYPTLKGHSYNLQWENFGNIFSEYGNKAKGIGEEYRCYLLIPEGEIPEDYNRTHFAGYIPYPTKENKANKGTIIYRGKDIGELEISFNSYNDFYSIKIGCSNSPSKSEREMLENLIVPKLREFVSINKEELRNDAIKRLKERMSNQIKEARESINKAEEQIKEAIF